MASTVEEISAQMSADEWQTRCNLAACYRLVDMLEIKAACYRLVECSDGRT